MIDDEVYACGVQQRFRVLSCMKEIEDPTSCWNLLCLISWTIHSVCHTRALQFINRDCISHHRIIFADSLNGIECRRKVCMGKYIIDSIGDEE